jgi:hypothetical protein
MKTRKQKGGLIEYGSYACPKKYYTWIIYDLYG